MSIINKFKNRFSKKQKTTSKPKTEELATQLSQQKQPKQKQVDESVKSAARQTMKNVSQKDTMTPKSVDGASPPGHTPTMKKGVDQDKPHRSITQNKPTYNPNIQKEVNQAKQRDKGKGREL